MNAKRPDFLSRHWDNPFNIDGWKEFLVGTCYGTWRFVPGQYEILAIVNSVPGNGDTNHALSWFIESCARDKANLLIREVMNEKFAAKLVKMGFMYKNDNDLILYYERQNK